MVALEGEPDRRVLSPTEPPGQPDASADKGRLVSNTVLNGLAQTAGMVASIIFMPLLIKAFGLEKYGLYMLASSVTAYAALLDFGAGSALTKMVAQHKATGDRDALAGTTSSTLTFYTAVGFLVAAAMVVLGVLAGSIFHVDGNGAALMRNMLWVGAIFQLWYWPSSTARHVLAGLQRFDVLAGTGVLTTVLSIGATVYVLVSGEGPVVLLAANGVVVAVASLFNIVVARRLLGLPVMSYRAASRAHMAAIFSFSWAIFVVQLSDALFYQQTDRVILGIFAGASSVALYEAAAKFNALVAYLSGLTVSAVLPLASSLDAQERHASLKSLLLRGTKYTSALVAPITLVLMVFTAPIISVWLGSGFEGQALTAQVLVFPHVLVCLGVMGDAIIISRGRLAGRIPYIFAQAILNVVLSVMLVDRYGVMGVAIGTAVSHLVDWPLHMRFLLKETGTNASEWMRSVIAPIYPLLVVPVLAALALARTPLAGSLIGIAVASAISVLLYWVAVFFVGLSHDERHDIGQLGSGMRRRVTRRFAGE